MTERAGGSVISLGNLQLEKLTEPCHCTRQNYNLREKKTTISADGHNGIA